MDVLGGCVSRTYVDDRTEAIAEGLQTDMFLSKVLFI